MKRTNVVRTETFDAYRIGRQAFYWAHADFHMIQMKRLSELLSHSIFLQCHFDQLMYSKTQPARHRYENHCCKLLSEHFTDLSSEKIHWKRWHWHTVNEY